MTLGYTIYKWMQAQTIAQFCTEVLYAYFWYQYSLFFFFFQNSCIFSSYKMYAYNIKKKEYYFHLTVIIPM